MPDSVSMSRVGTASRVVMSVRFIIVLNIMPLPPLRMFSSVLMTRLAKRPILIIMG